MLYSNEDLSIGDIYGRCEKGETDVSPRQGTMSHANITALIGQQNKVKRPQTSKRPRPAVMLASSNLNMRSSNAIQLFNAGPSSTTNLNKPRASHSKAHSLHFGQPTTDIVSHPTQTCEAGRQSIAERSVLSQNFVIGEEKSEKSLMGAASEEEDVSKAYDEFKERVNKLSRVSTAATHRQFMDEISECKYRFTISN